MIEQKLTALFFLFVLCASVQAQVTHAPPGKVFLLLDFNQSMDTTTLKDKTHYKVYDQYFNETPVLNVATMYYPTGVCKDSSIVLLANRFKYKTSYIVRVDSVRGKNGELINTEHNSAWFYFDGFNTEGEIPETYLHRK